MLFFFFFNDTATTEIYTLSLHDVFRSDGLSFSLRSVSAVAESPAVRIQALAALDGMGGIMEPGFLHRLEDPHPDVRRQAVRIAERIPADRKSVV